jgi:hypothetical protein
MLRGRIEARRGLKLNIGNSSSDVGVTGELDDEDEVDGVGEVAPERVSDAMILRDVTGGRGAGLGNDSETC